MRVPVLSGIATLFAFGIAFFWSDFVELYHKNTTPPVSIVDAQCGKLWVPRAQNDPALTCYLQTRIERLCDPAERDTLVWVFNRYVSEREIYLADLRGALIAISAQYGIKSALARAKRDVPLGNLSEATRRVATDMKSKGVGASMNVDIIPRSKMAGFIRVLGAKGYLQREDFGWWPDSLVTRGFDGVGDVKSPCLSKLN